jgi:putative membrane protein
MQAVATRFLDGAAKDALQAAVRAIEQGSSAEVVIAVRTHSGTYAHADILAGALAAWAALGVMLFAPTPFGWISIFVDPALVGVAVALLARRLPVVRLALSRKASRHLAVQRAAEALFVEKKIGRTRDRSGLLVYVSQLERRVVLVPDTGIEGAVDAETWSQHARAIDSAAAAGGVAVAGALQALAPVLQAALPRRADDVNELPDEVHAS